MLPRERRLTAELFDQTMLSGKLFNSPVLTLVAMKAPQNKPQLSRISAVAPKKVFKTAVERNRVRRRLYAAITREFLEKLDSNPNKFPFYCVVMAKPAMLKLTKPEITAAITGFFVKSGIIK